MVTDKTVRAAISAFGSRDPTPGGGSASALAGAVGAALLHMAATLPKTRTGAEEERAKLASSAGELVQLSTSLTNAIDADAAAYDQVVAAYRLPKTTEAEQTARTQAVQRALQAASGVPLGVLKAVVETLDHGRIIAASGYAATRSDVGVAIALLTAAARGAGLNIEANLGSLKDAGFVESARAERDRLEHEALAMAEEAERVLWSDGS